MIKCPKCGGYGKAVSTRNLKDGIIRYHKCDNCKETFTSTQRVDKPIITRDTIDSILTSEKFKTIVYPLFAAFGLIDFSMYNNEKIVPDWATNYFIISSAEFNDSKKGKARFDICIRTSDETFSGIIELVNLSDSHEIESVEAIVGTIDNLNGYTHLNLDIPTVNKLNK